MTAPVKARPMPADHSAMSAIPVQALDVAGAAGPSRVRLALGALVGVVALGVVVTDADEGFGFGATITAPVLLAAGLLALAATFAATIALTSAAGVAKPRLLTLAGVLAALAVVHLDIRSIPFALEAGLALGVVGFGVLDRSRDLALAGVALLASPLWSELDVFATTKISWFLAAVGGVLACSALAERQAVGTGSTAEFADAAVRLLSSLDLRLVALAVGGAILLLGLAGLAFDVGAVSRDSLDLNAEHTPAAAFSSLLLFMAASVAFVLALALSDHDERRSWALLAAVLGFLSLDELALVHEAIQEDVGVKGQIVLAPVAIVGFIAWLGVMRNLDRDGPAARMLIGAAGAWVLAQLLDVGQDPEKDRLMFTVVPEEVLEMIGSALFLMAGLYVVHSLGTRVSPRRGAAAV